MRLSTIIGRPIEDSSRKQLGTLSDIRFSGSSLSSLKAEFLLYHPDTYLKRLGIVKTLKKSAAAIKSITPGKIVIS